MFKVFSAIKDFQMDYQFINIENLVAILTKCSMYLLNMFQYVQQSFDNVLVLQLQKHYEFEHMQGLFLLRFIL